MNILHILDHSLPLHSGYAFRSHEILSALERMDFTVAARTGPKHKYSGQRTDTDLGIDYRRSGYGNRLLAALPLIRQLEVIRVLRRDICMHDATERIDVIHAHSPSLNGIAAIMAGKSQNIPVVYEMRASWEDAAVDHGTSKHEGLRYKMTKYSETWALNHADAITTICDGLKENICARGIEKEKVTVVPNAVDTDRFRALPDSRDRLRREFGAQGKFVITFCGSFYYYEGLDILIEAMSQLVSRFPDSLVLLAGGGEQEDNLKRQVSSMRLDDHVQFLGRVEQEKVIDLYNLCDVCVFPRRRMKLTDMVTPLKPLEAMASGAAVLASDVGGHKELISDKRTGLLFSADDPGALADLLCNVRGDQGLAEMRIAAQRFVQSERTWSAIASRYIDVYRRVTLSRS